WATLQPQVNGEFALSRHLETTEGGVAILRLQVPALAEQDRLLSLASHCTLHFQYVILHAGTAVPLPLLFKCFSYSDRVFLLLQPRAEDLYYRDLLFREVRDKSQADLPNLRTIVCREKAEEHFNDLLKRMGKEV